MIPARLKPRIRTALLAINLLLLGAPLGGLWLLRIYESALVRQTETELLAQAAVIAATARALWPAEAAGPLAEPPPDLAPRFATLDLARDPILPPPPEATPPATAPDPAARRLGEALTPILAEAQRATLAAMRVTDRRGTVIASSGGDRLLSLAAQEEVAAALAGAPAARLRARRDPTAASPGSISRAAPFRVFVALPISNGETVLGAVLLSRTPASIEQALYGKRWELAALALALILAAAALALVIDHTVGRPIRAVAEQAKAVAAGARMPLRRTRRAAIRESDELFAAIASMAATLERRADYIGHFAVAISHEFKTPLAALRGALELLQDHTTSMTEAERAGFLDQCLADVARLDRLTRRLLDLARAEAPAAALPARTPIREAATAAAAASPLPVTLDGPDITAAIAPETLRDILAMLLDNTRQHAGPDASCAIAWSAAAGQVRIRIADTGRGISAGNAPRIFDRFFTTARDSGGTGLGLAIARAHAEAAGGTLELLPEGPGAVFLLALPA